MSDVSGITSNAISEATTATNNQSLSSDEFMKVMITELTNQDPLEPMSNQELMSQMATMQQMQSNSDMSSNFTSLINKFDNLLSRESLSTATKMIGELVSGTATDGQFAIGNVMAVNMKDGALYLELDTGQQIAWDDLQRLGGNSTQDMIGDMVVGKNLNGTRVVGEVASVQMDNEQVLLHLQTAEGTQEIVPLSEASIIKDETADLLMGYVVKGTVDGEMVYGTVDSVQWTPEGVMLNLARTDAEGQDVYRTLPLSQLTEIGN